VRWGPRPLGPATRRPSTQRPKDVGAPPVARIRNQSIEPETETSDPLARDSKLACVEAALLLADEPLTSKRIAEAVGLNDGTESRKCLLRLRELYEADGTPFQIVELAGGYQLLTRERYHAWLVRLRRTGHDARLTAAALETLAVVAYRQPIMRAEVERIRGVNCAELIRVLMERGLVRIAGRHDSLGRPQLYGTTRKFLQLFGLNTLKELPAVEALAPPRVD
jgi:segregation and condensation protein B